ncbi:Ribosome biogenesis protein bop1-B [Acropora cervicornis]|uniref:Ribosome biogenesis protein bop1-B n=1 Tax=Acropora cervicornis TaxID=6130 RepID=A0AAD9Q4T5_ACRCE|nr:Ribosome biogenesis protein bop1-B [Acropora cervicornis]
MPKRSADQSVQSTKSPIEAEEDLFHSENGQDDKVIDTDSSDSEESEYSGLESEPETSDDENSDQELESEDSGKKSSDDSEQEEKEERTEQFEKETNKESKEENNNKYREEDSEDVVAEPGFEDENTSDEEDARNTVGNIPIEWYNDYPHIGYNLDGKKILKPATADELDEFLAKMDDPNYWRTVRDKATMREVILSNEELDIINRLQNYQFPSASYDPYEPYVDFFTAEKMIHPVSGAIDPKSRHIPSKWEHKKGWIKPKKDDKIEKPRYYLIWDKEDDKPSLRKTVQMPAPKMKLPGHEESYNPPPEYLPTEEEIAAWEARDGEKKLLPKKQVTSLYSSLRLVPAYNKFIRERFERCLDLYLCPRKRVMRANVKPEDLIPKLPKPKDLQPFPTTESIVYKGHKGAVRCGDDKAVKLWEVCTGRCIKTLQCDGAVHSLAWNPNPSLTLLAVAVCGRMVRSLRRQFQERRAFSYNAQKVPFQESQRPRPTRAVSPNQTISLCRFGPEVKFVRTFSGDNVIVGSYDRRLCWFDMDLSVKPYRTLK